MAISPQQLTIYLYSAHRAVIFAIAQLSCYIYAVNIQHEVTGNNVVFSEDHKGSVWKSWDRRDDVCLGWVIWENSLRRFAIDAVDDFVSQ